MTVTIKPMPQHPPIHARTPEEIELAIELFKILDDESKDWYGGQGFLDALERANKNKKHMEA